MGELGRTTLMCGRDIIIYLQYPHWSYGVRRRNLSVLIGHMGCDIIIYLSSLVMQICIGRLICLSPSFNVFCNHFIGENT